MEVFLSSHAAFLPRSQSERLFFIFLRGVWPVITRHLGRGALRHRPRGMAQARREW